MMAKIICLTFCTVYQLKPTSMVLNLFSCLLDVEAEGKDNFTTSLKPTKMICNGFYAENDTIIVKQLICVAESTTPIRQV